MRVLLVDDEQPAVEGLERMLFARAPDWEVDVATSGAEALELLGDDTYDAIVTDMRMPEMDGAELLREVQLAHPQVARVVLTGHTTLEAAMAAIPIAHQFLNKPCSPERLISVLDRACSLQRLVADPKLRAAVGSVNGLPAVPRIYTELSEAMAHPEASAHDLARIVESDVALSAKVLHVANSTFFASARPADTVDSAVARLGPQALRALVLSSEVFQTFRASAVTGFSVEAFQRHSVMAAALSGQIVQDRTQKAQASLAGLMHDVGTLVLASHAPSLLEESLAEASATGETVWTVERRQRGVTHAELGAYLLGLWSLPPEVVQAIALHHDPPDDLSRRGLREALYLADVLLEGDSTTIRPDDGGVAALLATGAVTENELQGWREAISA